MSPVAAAEKFTITHGFLATVEGSYGGGGSVTGADDAILVEEAVDVVPSYIFDGSRGDGVGQGAPYTRAQPGGRMVEGMTVPVLFRGANSTYSASVVPDDVHDLLQICGHEATVDSTGGAEKWTYAPETDPATHDSGYAEAYTRGELLGLAGLLGSLSFEIDGPSFCRMEFELSGIVDAAPSDTTVPALTIADHQPPKAEDLSLSIGNYGSARCRAVRFNQNRTIASRADVNAADGHAGFAGTFRRPTLEVDIEASALATSSPWTSGSGIDPYELFHVATTLALSFEFGAQYNRMRFEADQAQMSGPPQKGEDDDVALWTLPFELIQSDPGADDDYRIIAN